MLPGAVEILRETLRSGDEGKSVIGIRSSCNPGGPSHTNIKVNYVEATDYGKNVIVDSHGRTVRYIPAKVDDNPHVGKDYRRTLEAIPTLASAQSDARRRLVSIRPGNSSANGPKPARGAPGRRHARPQRQALIAASISGTRPRLRPSGERTTARADGGFTGSCTRKASHRQSRRAASWLPERKAGELDVVHFIDPSTVAKATGWPVRPGELCHSRARARPGRQRPHQRVAAHARRPRRRAAMPVPHADGRAGRWSGTTCPMLHVSSTHLPELSAHSCRMPPMTRPGSRISIPGARTHDILRRRYLLSPPRLGGRPRPVWRRRRATPFVCGGAWRPPPLPMILGSPYAGDMRAGLSELGVSFEREDGSTPGATQRSPFAP